LLIKKRCRMKAHWTNPGVGKDRPKKKNYFPGNYSQPELSVVEPEDSNLSQSFDLGEFLGLYPSRTFYYTVEDNSMIEVGYGSVVVIDREVKPVNGDLVLVYLDGDILLRKWNKKTKNLIELQATNGRSIEVDEFCNFSFVGTAKGIVKSLR